MNNDDFRRLLATPSAHSSSTKSASSASQSHTFTHRHGHGGANHTNATAKTSQKKKNFHHTYHDSEKVVNDKDEEDIFDESQARLNEILKNYRDRAAERRKGVSKEEFGSKLGYKAVPGILANSSVEDMRKLEIQKSKYLGGDIEHTHLVKGLDYSLLNKVRNEMHDREVADREREEKEAKDSVTLKAQNSKMAANICKMLFENNLPKRNELFARGRMAYLVDLEDEESDVPSTLLRSVFDCPVDQSSENINADNLLINKLTQVLAYLRTDVKKRKRGEDRTVETEKERQKASNNIFEGVDEYEPSKERRNGDGRERSGQSKGKSYFETDRDGARRDRDRDTDRDRHRERRENERKREREEEKPGSQTAAAGASEDHLEKLKKRRMEQEDAYAELYPGGLGMMDAGGESEDEADYTQMDMGNRKGPVKRWDFETQEDYERYQGNREANPKAAYQFGVKASGGRKTRKNAAAAKERKLDRELEKINKILDTGVKSKVKY